jgi:hypothetical protein
VIVIQHQKIYDRELAEDITYHILDYLKAQDRLLYNRVITHGIPIRETIYKVIRKEIT